jgi:endonuclease/exonuclease/phosphatase (EEP) superfamily protein YafD
MKLTNTLTIITILIIILSVIGHIIRDLTVELALLMYIPLLPLGLWTILWGALKTDRYFLIFLGLAIIIWGGVSMMGTGGTLVSLERNINIVHWNVRWGGGWQSVTKDIKQKQPDIIIISETPSKSKLNQLLKQLGNKWSMVMYSEKRKNPLAVYSAWPLKLEHYIKIHNARAMTVIVTVYGQPLRLLAIDAGRNMSERLTFMSKKVLPRWRTPMLMSMLNTIKSYHANGKPIDIIVGDFNALSRSLGFEKFNNVAGGYHLAAKFSFGWRGTWISYLPLYDLDHVWVHKRFQELETELFANFNTDHRGQVVHLHIPFPM